MKSPSMAQTKVVTSFCSRSSFPDRGFGGLIWYVSFPLSFFATNCTAAHHLRPPAFSLQLQDHTQIMQERIQESQIGTVNSVQTACYQLFSVAQRYNLLFSCSFSSTPALPTSPPCTTLLNSILGMVYSSPTQFEVSGLHLHRGYSIFLPSALLSNLWTPSLRCWRSPL